MTSAAVEKAMRDIAESLIRPRFRALADSDISTKSGPDDLVTIADVEAEQALTPLLREIDNIPVVGEEATASDPSLPEVLGTAEAAWLVDPVDGTWNFAHGKVDYAVMVARVRGGESSEGWILHPETGDLLRGDADSGVSVVDGSGASRSIAPVVGPMRPLSDLSGMAVLRYASKDISERLAGFAAEVGEVTPPRMCAGWDYWDLLAGDVDFLLYFRAKPWDHAPGTAIARAAGYEARYLDGTDYRPDLPSRPFLVARPGEWDALAAAVNAHAGRTL